MTSRFVRPTTFTPPSGWGPLVHVRPPLREDSTSETFAHTTQRRSHFVRPVPVQPSPFQVARGLWMPLPAEAHPNRPLHLQCFLARVEDQLGRHQPLTVWELPSWRRLEAELSLDALDPEREVMGPFPPLPGDLLWLWTWTDQPEVQAPVERLFVRIERKVLTPDELALLPELHAHFTRLQAHYALMATQEKTSEATLDERLESKTDNVASDREEEEP